MNLKEIEKYASAGKYPAPRGKTLTERQLKNARAKCVKRITTQWESMENQPIPNRLTIVVTWKKSRMWGCNPHAVARAYYNNSHRGTFKATAGGCGYDKLSTVVADVMNQSLGGVLLYAMKQIKSGKVEQPYAIGWNKASVFPARFSGGIGISCYDGSTFENGKLGFTFEPGVYTDTLDIYEINVKQKLINAWEKRHKPVE